MKKKIKLTESQLKEMIGSILKEYSEFGHNLHRIEAKDNPKTYYNCHGIHFIWHGEWADPELEYNGKYVNYYDIDNWMYELAKENNIKPDTVEYTLMVQDYCDDIKRYIDEHGQSTEEETLGESKKHINEAEDGGWVVEEYEADDAYNLAAEMWGTEDLNEQIVGCLGKERLAECLAFIFRVNNFTQRTEYQAKKEEDDIHESKDDFEAAKYNGKWSVFDKVSRTYSNIGVGKKKATETAKALNQPK